jgi:hypothetical protein
MMYAADLLDHESDKWADLSGADAEARAEEKALAREEEAKARE